jgi:hypothetical protein
MNTRLLYKNYPKTNGAYYAGNHSTHHNRLEIDSVCVVDGEVYTDNDPKPFIFTDFDYWSEQVTKSKIK